MISSKRINEEEYKYIDKTEILKLSPEDDLKVYRNFAKDYQTLRVLIDEKDIYLWDAKKFTHDQVADRLFGEDYSLHNQFMFDTIYKEIDDYSIRNTISTIELSKDVKIKEKLYNDFFKYYKIIKERLGVDFSKAGLEKVAYLKGLFKNTLTESFEELETGIWTTTSAYDVLNWLKNKPKAYRVVYDQNIRQYFIGDAYDWIHQEMLEAAYRSGFYPDMFSEGEVRDYIDEEIFEGTLLFFAFSPDSDKRLDVEKSSDGYTRKYVYDFGSIYAHEMTPLEDFDIWSLLNKPLKKETILENSYAKLNEELKPYLK